MEEMMKKSTVAMGNNQNGVVSKSKVENPNADHMEIDTVMIEDDAALEVINFSRRFPKCIEAHLQKDWPMVTTALKEYGFSCELDLVKSSMTFSTTRTIDPRYY
ncbi:hypothetical protein M0R45_028792 [Rubus argutus]|uniref:KRR-R motif-containing protein 1 n=1 Tax=Rubus argutus TaxID=59490 RepID=A0AAW1W9S3_RUBAR